MTALGVELPDGSVLFGEPWSESYPVCARCGGSGFVTYRRYDSADDEWIKEHADCPNGCAS